MKLQFVLVNHNIRKNSLKEALMVKSLLKKYKIDLKILNNHLCSLFNEGIDGTVISDVIDLNIDFNEKLNYIIDFALSISKEGNSNIHPVRLSDFIQELSNFRENLFEINSLNQRYSLHHLLLRIPC